MSRHEQLFGSVIMTLDRNGWATMLRSGDCCTRVSFETAAFLVGEYKAV
jgi:hypothetical protein